MLDLNINVNFYSNNVLNNVCDLRVDQNHDVLRGTCRLNVPDEKKEGFEH